MEAVRLHALGGAEKLVLENAPMPVAGPGEVLVKIEAAGINFADIERRRGGVYSIPMSLPYILGGEFVGTVVAQGQSVSKPKVGDRVFGLVSPAKSGCYAQYAAVPASSAVPLPDGIEAGAALALLVQGLTAWFLLEDGVMLAEHDSILIMAAAGGVGSMAVQLASIRFGCKNILAAASTPEKRDLILELGAHVAIDYTTAGWAEAVKAKTGGKGVNAALLMTGGAMFVEALKSLAPFCRARVYGTANGEMPVIDYGDPDMRECLGMNQTVGFFFLKFYQMHAADRIRWALDEMVRLVMTGELQAEARGFPLGQVADAHNLIEARGSTGKIFLMPWERA